MALTDKEIAHFQSELPKGMVVVDFREIKNKNDFIEKYCPEGDKKNLPHSVCMRIALEKFIKEVKK